jgi:ABC-type multidrug transport system fused ATPase/permease subunit
LEPSIFRYLVRHSLRSQLLLVLLSGASFPFLWIYYEMPKKIVRLIQAPADAYPRSFWGYTFPETLFGIRMDQVGILMTMCLLLLLLVLINQRFKYFINVYKGITGERMLRRLRYDLYARILRFPLPTFRRMSPGEIIPMITGEVEPLGGFIGDAFALPAFQGGTLIVILTFLFLQNPIMAGAAVALYPLQILIIPRLQRRVNQLGKERVRLMRKVADRIGETVQGVQEVHAHDTSNLELADFSHRLGTVYSVRVKIYNQKFTIKNINNFIQQLGPILFYSIGGYLVIHGKLDIGTLVAAIAAHKDLAAPWKELLDFYQQKEDARIKYEQVVSQFEPAGLRPDTLQHADPPFEGPLPEPLAAINLGLVDEHDLTRLDHVNLRIARGERVAIVGPPNGGRDDLAMVMARLLDPTSGRVALGEHDMAGLPESVTGRRMAFLGPSSHIFSASIADNLFYGLKHRPLKPVEDQGAGARERARRRRDAQLAGNTAHEVDADWIDYAAAGVADRDALIARAVGLLALVGLDRDVYQFGLLGTVDPAERPAVAERFLRARDRLRERLAEPDLAPLIERFDAARFNMNASVAENVLFGTPVGTAFDPNNLAGNPYVIETLDRVGLTDELVRVGQRVAETMIELFAGLPPDHEFFAQFSFIAADDLPEFQAVLARAEKGRLDADDRRLLLGLPFKIVPARHRLDLLDAGLRDRLLEARRAFAAHLPAKYRGAIAFFDEREYNAAANIQDNILFGKIAYGVAEGAERIGELVSEVVNELGLREVVAEIGLGFQCGIAGSRLTGAQRQRLALARALIKRPDLLIMSDALSAVDPFGQHQILARLLDGGLGSEASLVCVCASLEMASRFDRIAVMVGGRLVEQGTFSELNRPGTRLASLQAAE